MLAGVSVDYYTKLERGTVGNVSSGVLDAVARALQMNSAEREHLYSLLGATPGVVRGRRRNVSRSARPAIQRILDGIVDAPAVVLSDSRYLIAANRLGRGLYSPMYEASVDGIPNTIEYTFLEPSAHTFFVGWEKAASDSVANIRFEVARYPDNEELTALIDTLNRGSAAFRALWRAHDVRNHDTGTKSIHHPIVGDLHLSFEAMELPADPGQTLLVYGAEPGSASADALRLLGSWSAEVSNIVGRD